MEPSVLALRTWHHAASSKLGVDRPGDALVVAKSTARLAGVFVWNGRGNALRAAGCL
jgi:hypothetical protein